ncbi:carbonic anhydrase [Rhodoferax sp. PAMC 29310]|uniref:carbonic anhydrase n=1 Tax=Rhodoferax sp. PAMC 29310 TaxID=2822760 RepID=UPI001B325500|nr:carbonic anhydrase family protein [Rhodoferax sp. PAMC 29310]
MTSSTGHAAAHKSILLTTLLLSLCLALPTAALASGEGKAVGKAMGDQVRAALEGGALTTKRLTLIVNGEAMASPDGGGTASGEHVEHTPHQKAATPVDSKASRKYIRAKAAELTGSPLPPMAKDSKEPMHGGKADWSYAGETGPQTWSKINPDFGTCGAGDRQSPINIDEAITLKGPAETLQFHYQPSNGTVINNGHTIQVDVQGDNWLTVRGTEFKLLQFHFHHPSEERVNSRGSAMVAHLVHQSSAGQLAVVAVLLDPGELNTLINKVWTYMPLDKGDSVRMPVDMVNLTELLPTDQRYYQFMGSLTTPPCTEGVLWMVLKEPTPVAREQIKLFSQLFPNNARPVQPTNGRAVRSAQ